PSCQLNDSPSRKWNLRKTGLLVNKKVKKILKSRIRKKGERSGGKSHLAQLQDAALQNISHDI
ncbi:hypothetical protein, partial [Desulfovibrio piger]|uniref:hypothetical protein n=1 Tax=Desulfovibrio piger TaxID=901 RepID=UPI003F0D586C